MSMASVTDFTDGELVDELQDRGFTVTWGRGVEIAELRQQLADRDEQISDLTISSDTYFAERNSARDVWRRASKDRDELRQQLAAALACNILLKDALFDTLIQEMSRESAIARIEAIALQPDNSALRAWLGEPVAWKHDDPNRHDAITDTVKELLQQVNAEYMHRPIDKTEHYTIPLYSPKGLK